MKKVALLMIAVSSLLFLFVIKKMGKEKTISTAPVQSQTQVNLITSSAPILTPKPNATQNLSVRIHVLAQRIDRLGDATLINSEVIKEAQNLNSNDADHLLQIALDQSKSANERFLAVYLAGIRASEFMLILQKIAATNSDTLNSSPEPHSLQQINKNFELSLRIEALKALDSLANSKANELADLLREIRSTSKNQMIKKLASIAYVGALQHEPILEQYIEAKLQASKQ